MNDESPDDRIDRLLAETGTAWRAAQPTPGPVAALLVARRDDAPAVAPHPRRPWLRRGAVVVAAAVVVVLVVLAFVLPHVLGRPSSHAVTPLDPSDVAATFVGVQPGDGGASSVDLLSRADGSVAAKLFTSDAGQLSAVRLSPSAVVVARSVDCTATVMSVDVATDAVTTLWTADGTVKDMTLSPDGTRIAFLTDSPCQKPYFCPGTCSGGPADIISLRPVVADLRTGAHRQAYAAPIDQAYPPLAWSPDGTQLASTDNDGLLDTWTVDRPDDPAAVLHPPANCNFRSPVWISTGLLVGLGCGTDPLQLMEPSKLVRIDDQGTTQQSWPLPDCIDGYAFVPDTGGGVLVQTDVGYGNDACSHDWHVAVFSLDGASLTPLFQLPVPFGGGTEFGLQSG